MNTVDPIAWLAALQPCNACNYPRFAIPAPPPLPQHTHTCAPPHTHTHTHTPQSFKPLRTAGLCSGVSVAGFLWRWLMKYGRVGAFGRKSVFSELEVSQSMVVADCLTHRQGLSAASAPPRECWPQHQAGLPGTRCSSQPRGSSHPADPSQPISLPALPRPTFQPQADTT